MGRWLRYTAILAVTTITATVAAGAELSGSFIDDDGNVHERNVEAIAAEGITRGCNPPANHYFCPEGEITRGQMAAFLKRALGLPNPTDDWFDDDSGHTFETDVNALYESGITRGCNPPDNDRFCPDEVVTRGQMAAFLRRAFHHPAASGDHFDDDAVGRDQMASFLARAIGLAPVPPGVPADPGDAVNCSTFGTWQEAQDWFDLYAPHYGDVAHLDGNGDGVACESLPGAP